jgi:hypothetical protein
MGIPRPSSPPTQKRRGARDCACLGWKGTCVSRALPAGGEVPRNPTNGYALIDDSSEHRSTYAYGWMSWNIFV